MMTESYRRTCPTMRPCGELMSDLMAETSETKIKPSVQETVDALRTLQAKVGSEGVTAKAVGRALKLDKSSAYRRLGSAMEAGVVKNMETRKFQPGLYRTVDNHAAQACHRHDR